MKKSERKPDDYDPRYTDDQQQQKHPSEANGPQANRNQIRRRATETPSQQQHESSGYHNDEEYRRRQEQKRLQQRQQQQKRHNSDDRDEEYRKQNQDQKRRQQQQQQQQERQKRIEDEPIYLKAVDSPRDKKSSSDNIYRHNDHEVTNSDRERAIRSQEEIYRQSREEQQHNSKSSSRHSKDVRSGSSNREPRNNSRSAAPNGESSRLIDDQMMLRQQVRDVGRVGRESSGSYDQLQSSSSSSSSSSRKKKNDIQQHQQSQKKQQHHEHEYVNSTRPSGHARDTRHEIFYDEPEQNNRATPVDYTNVARSIDPTYKEPDYQTIPKGGLRGQIGILDAESPLSKVVPVAVPQNEKRSTKKDDSKKKSKKWF